MIIALDGPAGAGKSTVPRGRRCARLRLHRRRGDVPRRGAGGRQRAAGRAAISFDEQECVWLDGRDVTGANRTREVSEAASRVSTDPAVREAMVEQQRALLHDGRDWVAEGRDIGTVSSASGGGGRSGCLSRHQYADTKRTHQKRHARRLATH